jgi:raffinose/stachyose/melibiose transport system substrate-binding protein
MHKGPDRFGKRRSALTSHPSALASLVAATLFIAAPTAAQTAAGAQTPSAVSFAANCGTAPVTLSGYFETGFPDAIDLANLFTKQYPNVKWDIRQDAFAVITQDAPLVLSGPNPPDLMRLPTWSGLVKDHLLKNLDGFYNTFGWDKFPASDLASLRVAPSGAPSGIGPLWGMGLNYSMTGLL